MKPIQVVPVTVGQAKQDLPKHLLVWLFLGIELFPLYMMLQTSVKTNAAFLSSPWWPTSFFSWEWSNFIFGTQLILPYVANTVFVAVAATVGTLLFAVMGAYFFARYKMPGSGLLYGLFLFLMLVPSIANIVPLFELLKHLNLLNSLWALVLLGVASGQVFNIFVLRNFIEDLPRDLFEAAEIDGASHLQQIRNVVLPMCAPILGTLAVLTFLGQWNDFMMPLIVLRDPELFTIGVGLIYLDGAYVKEWGKIMAAYLIASIPLVLIFLCMMKLFIRGLSAGAIKG
jgi:ABC-type glycerol-3-phosphate transport system permease component